MVRIQPLRPARKPIPPVVLKPSTGRTALSRHLRASPKPAQNPLPRTKP